MKLFLCDLGQGIPREKVLGEMEIQDIEQTKKLVDFLDAVGLTSTIRCLKIAESYRMIDDDGYPLLILEGEDRWRQKNQNIPLSQLYGVVKDFR